MTINNKIERVIEKRPSRVHIFFTVDKDTIEERLGFSITDEQLEDIDNVYGNYHYSDIYRDLFLDEVIGDDSYGDIKRLCEIGYEKYWNEM